MSENSDYIFGSPETPRVSDPDAAKATILGLLRGILGATSVPAVSNALDIQKLGPVRRLAAVTPSDSVLVNCDALYVGGAGNVAIIAVDDSAAVTLTAIPAGALLPISCKKIMSTNTTATLMVALFSGKLS